MTYWLYTYLSTVNNLIRYGWGIHQSANKDFNYAQVLTDKPNLVILHTAKVSSSQYKSLYDLIESRRKLNEAQ